MKNLGSVIKYMFPELPENTDRNGYFKLLLCHILKTEQDIPMELGK